MQLLSKHPIFELIYLILGLCVCVCPLNVHFSNKLCVMRSVSLRNSDQCMRVEKRGVAGPGGGCAQSTFLSGLCMRLERNQVF